MKTSHKIVSAIMMVSLMLLSFLTYANSNQNTSVEVVTLEESNTVVINSGIDETSINAAILEINNKLESLKKNGVLYLVLNTDGGNVRSGIKFISYLKSLNIEVKTISIKAYSMGFHIAENLGERLITEYGSMMTHQMRMTTYMIQFPIINNSLIGEELNQTKKMDKKVSRRLNVEYDDYVKMIGQSFYVYGDEAIEKNFADRVIQIACGKSYKDSMKCPLYL